MKPIPKKLLIHTVVLYEKTSIDKWGSEKLDDGQVLSKVRIEPSRQIVRDKNNSEIQLAATLFYDCRNSQPIYMNCGRHCMMVNMQSLIPVPDTQKTGRL